ncbi:MAG: polyphosphate kinase 1, partial [Spirochaetales bacterium]|nr:polyphosphate kinase 1 [Spirochaetales bacterium]
IGLFTARKKFGSDASAIFNLLTGYSEPPRWKKLVTAPLDLRSFFLEKINRETQNAKSGGKGKIVAKMNALIDTKVIDALYQASSAGVEIVLIVRGMCRLKAGIPGLSENITVRSIVDVFLEHSRVFWFHNQGNDELFLASADWMERNLDKRVEILFPIEDLKLIDEVKKVLDIILSDNKKTRLLQPNGTYKHIQKEKNEEEHRSQLELYEFFKKRNMEEKEKQQIRFIPNTKPENI